MSRHVIDAYGWVEYLDGTQAGLKVKDIVENEDNRVYTVAVTIAEVVSKFIRRNMDPRVAYTAITALSRIVHIDAEASRMAGEVHAEKRRTVKDFGLADAYVLSAAHKLKAKVVTGDPHFSGLKDVIFI